MTIFVSISSPRNHPKSPLLLTLQGDSATGPTTTSWRRSWPLRNRNTSTAAGLQLVPPPPPSETFAIPQTPAPRRRRRRRCRSHAVDTRPLVPESSITPTRSDSSPPSTIPSSLMSRQYFHINKFNRFSCSLLCVCVCVCVCVRVRVCV